MHSDTLQLIQILEKTVSPDKNELEQASTYLERAVQSNVIQLMQTLSDILRHGGNSPVARMAAGLQLKNQLTSKDATIKTMCQQRWLSAPEDIRMHIKRNVLSALGTESNRPSAAAQCVAYIAVAEIPQNQWLDVIATLVNNVVQTNSTEIQREATLEAIGYICQEIDADILVTQSNSILTAIIHGMRSSEPSNHVRLAGTRALLNSLVFTRANFEKETERNFIMEVVCEATQSSDIQIKVVALECLVRIMSLYYQYMEPYMSNALFPITLDAMKSDNDTVSLQGIEFWSNISELEVALAVEASEALDAGGTPIRTSRFYAKGALGFIVPILLEKLTNQEEFDDDEWNPSKAAGVCIMLLAYCCENLIVPHVFNFIKDNIKSNDWRFREASLMAFGSILGGLEMEMVKTLVEQAMPTLIGLLNDSSVAVRDTAAWTLGRICETIPETVITGQYLLPLLNRLINGLKEEPRVATNICWVFTGLAEGAYENATCNVDDDSEPATYCMSGYFNEIVLRLLETTDRSDGGQSNLRAAAYEALMKMVENSPKDCYATVQHTIMLILDRLQHVLRMEQQIVNHGERSELIDLQSLLCATLQSVLKKMSKEDAPRISDGIMNSMLAMFNSSASKNGSVHEDALMAVGTLVEALGEGFLKYMDAFKPYLIMGLKNYDEYQVCIAAVGLVGDIFRALRIRIMPYCDDIMTILLENLGNQTVHRSIKPQILSVFGDVALSIGGEFKKYLDVVVSTLSQASQAQVDRNDYDMVDYLNELREGVLDAYTGIIQGLKGDDLLRPHPDVMLLEPHISFIVDFIVMVARDDIHSEQTLGVASGLVGDLCMVFGVPLWPIVNVDTIHEMLAKGRRSSSSRTKALAMWAFKELNKLKRKAAPSAES